MEPSLLQELFEALLLLFGLIATAWLAGRILGVRQGFLRSVLAAFVGLLMANVMVGLQFGWDQGVLTDWGDVAEIGVGFVGYLLLGTMLASIVLDLIFRPRPKRDKHPPRVPHPIRAIKSRAALLGRVLQIMRIARSTGLMRRATRSGLTTPEGARALRLTLEQCGGMFVKFGQIASTREDLLPPVVLEELALLRSAAPPLPTDVVSRMIAEGLGEEGLAAIAEVDEQPLAAASIGVTHRARLTDGRSAIIKVQRPGVADQVDRDGRVLIWGAGVLERRSAQARSLGILDLATQLVDGVTEELDFTREAANNAAMLRNRADDRGIGIPKVFPELTSRQVLVMEEVPGSSVADVAAVNATGVPRGQLSDNLLSSYLGQVLTDGVYHADPHPGNVLIDDEGTLWFIDFGAVGNIDPITLQALQLMALGWSIRDPAVLARAVRRLAGPQAKELDMAALEFDLGSVVSGVESGGFSAESMNQILMVLQRHEVRAPRAMSLLARATITIEGTLHMLDPTTEMAVRAQRLIGEQNASPESFRKTAQTELVRALPSLRTLPELAEEVGFQARAGRLSLRLEQYAGEDRVVVGRWLNRVLFAIVGVVGLIGSSLLLLAAGVTPDAEFAAYLRVIGFVGLTMSTVMQFRTVAQIVTGPADP